MMTGVRRGGSMELRTLAREERADLAAFLKSLSPDQWEAPPSTTGESPRSWWPSWTPTWNPAAGRRGVVGELSGRGQPKLAHREV